MTACSPVDQETLAEAVGRLVTWLETWKSPDGAYNGFVVHRTETKRMGRVHDTAWTQAAMVRGYGNLYRKSREPRWGEAMTLAADLLASRYDAETGQWRNTGHEDDRFQSLVSCALAVCALLSISDLVDEERRARYTAYASDHACRYWIQSLWIEAEGAFRFSETDFYSPGEDRFVVNFNAMAAEALLALYRATGDDSFRSRALAVGDWLLARWAENKASNEAVLAGRNAAEEQAEGAWMAPGGFSYQFTTSCRKPDNFVTLYAGLSLRGFWALYEATADERYAELVTAQADYVLAMRDPSTHLFYHTAWAGKVESNPQFIAGAGMTLLGLHEVQRLIGPSALPVDTIHAILHRTYPNGACPGFVGKNDSGRPRRNGGGVVWEDVVASVNWNAQWFEFLTRLLDAPEEIVTGGCPKPIQVLSRRFFYRDSESRTVIVSWAPLRSIGVYYYVKRRPLALICLYPQAMYASLRKLRTHSRPTS